MEFFSFGLNEEFTSKPSIMSPAVFFPDSSRSKASQFLLANLFIYFQQLEVNPEHISVSDLLHMYYVI